MTLSNKVLLIEDDNIHAEMIVKFLVDHGYDVDLLKSNNDLAIYNYKSLSKCFVIIIDEILDGYEERSGFKLIVDKLVRLDRAMPYILFSKEPQQSRISREHSIPAMKFIKKALNNNELDSKCLGYLLGAVRGYYQYQMPTFRTPDYLAIMENMQTEIEHSEITDKNARESVVKSLSISGEIVDQIATFSSSLSRIGASSIGMTVGIFGSFGRFEARKSSDIEFSVLFDADYDEIALTAWNQIYRFCKGTFENEIEAQDDIGELLTSSYVEASRIALSSEKIPLNKYAPIFSPNDILPIKLQLYYPHLYFRMYQIIAEMSPVFNQDKMNAIKATILGFNIEERPKAIEVLLSDKMQVICDTYITYVKPEPTMSLDKVVKTVLFRTLGILAFRACIFRIVKYEQDILKSTGGATRLFQELSAPPIVKLQKLKRSVSSNDIKTNIDTITSLYAIVFEKLSSHKTNLSDLKFLNEVLSCFVKMLNELQKSSYEVGEIGKWVFDTTRISALQTELLTHLGKVS